MSGDITASGNMIAATPTAPNHLATRAYVDAQVASAGDNEMANCIPASQALMNAK